MDHLQRHGLAGAAAALPTEPAFPKLKFEEPLDLTYAPGTDRLFVAERWGKIWSFVNKKDVAKADLALEFKAARTRRASR